MRSLIVRFIDCEGPGILEKILREEKYSISYHDAFKRSEKIIPNAHLMFDILILMGGPQSVEDDSQAEFFSPYFELVRDFLSIPNRKVIGVCLGAQILSRVLGGKVVKGTKGIEAGFSTVTIRDRSDSIFEGISVASGTAFHLHEDTFTIPEKAKLLMSSEMYENQLFSFENRVFGFQCHLEATLPMVENWSGIHREFIAKSPNAYPVLDKQMQSDAEDFGGKIFRNIIRKNLNSVERK